MIIGPGFENLNLVEHNYLITISQGRKPVGVPDNGTIFHVVFRVFPDFLFGNIVKG
jgi:hypothetical protein